jgi:diaminopimelate decarboxylase
MLRFWRRLAASALRRGIATPFFIFSPVAVREALTELDRQDFGVPIRQWLSCKTQPVAPLLRWWRQQGRPIEVVSEFEFRAALASGFGVEDILVNGPAKQRWLPGVSRRGLHVNLDSPAELRDLLPLAHRQRWRLGIRIATRQEFDPEAPEWPTQFGFTLTEAEGALCQLQAGGSIVETVHFHLRTNVASPAAYERALKDVADVCRAARFQPKYVDVGGGLPPPWVLGRDGRRFDSAMKPGRLADMYRRTLKRFPGVRELWLENGRFLLARSGVLVLRVLEVKERAERRQLICDGGRTLHALVSTWEDHELITLPLRRGTPVLTTVHGPTCMAFDQLARRPLPGDIRAGDHLLWLDAGAYHIPWETRFSHGTAGVVWHDGRRLTVARRPGSFADYWRTWT